jgi:predicted DNA-binding transcriptional regulator YafY
MDQPKLERLLRLMKLLTSNVTYSVAEIAQRMNTSKRTIYRYIDTFRAAGFVIKKTEDSIRIDKSSPYFKEISSLVHFTDEEAFILKSAIESIDENNLIKQNLKKKLYTVYNYKILAETVVNSKDAQNVNRLVSAIENRKQVLLHDYSSAHGNDQRTRLVEPFAFTTNYIQLWAYEPEAMENKLFKISRISTVETLEDLWEHQADHKEGFMDIFRISSNALLPVKLQLSLRAAHLLIEEYPLAEKSIKQMKDNTWILDTSVCSYEGVGRFVFGLLSEVQILETAAFEEFIQTKINEYKKN